MTTVATLLAGAGMGALGQVVRALIGLKKTWDQAPADAKFSQLFDGHRFLITLALGVGVGALTGLFTGFVLTVPGNFFSKEQVLLLIASGYAGSDALEGLFSRAVAKTP